MELSNDLLVYTMR